MSDEELTKVSITFLPKLAMMSLPPLSNSTFQATTHRRPSPYQKTIDSPFKFLLLFRLCLSFDSINQGQEQIRPWVEVETRRNTSEV